jgi:hypothetical protein
VHVVLALDSRAFFSWVRLDLDSSIHRPISLILRNWS